MCICLVTRHGWGQSIQNWWVIPKLELLIKKKEIDKTGIEVGYKKKIIHKLIYLLIFLFRKYFFHDNPTWNINYSE